MVFGAIGWTVKVANAARAWHTGQSGSRYANMMRHFTDHGKGMGLKTVVQYTKAAQNVIKEGAYITTKNAFITLAEVNKYNFVGIIREGTKITTYSFRTFTKAAAILMGLM